LIWSLQFVKIIVFKYFTFIELIKLKKNPRRSGNMYAQRILYKTPAAQSQSTSQVNRQTSQQGFKKKEMEKSGGINDHRIGQFLC